MSTAFVICTPKFVNQAQVRPRGGTRYLPRFNGHACSLTHENHIARLGVVVDEIEQDDQLHKSYC